ncbi:carboxyl transferase domain-containing protein [Streptomyces sp. NPDC051183]|uniref:carboxyl transferase domain-containing protein n=1 Tax=unclassified Streptomyces TaxID=2593676 RepID=UPI00342B1C7E
MLCQLVLSRRVCGSSLAGSAAVKGNGSPAREGASRPGQRAVPHAPSPPGDCTRRVAAQSLYGQIFLRNVRLSGRVPQISLIMGPCAGGAVYSPALTDFVVMTDKVSHMFITGPEVIRAAMGEEVDIERLGGAHTHNARSGNAHYLAADEEDAIAFTKRLLSYLPANSSEEPPAGEPAPCSSVRLEQPPGSAPPGRGTDVHDMGEIITGVLDTGTFLEIQRLFAPNIEATVPLIAVITGRAYGGGYEVMGSKHLGADVNLAWPTALIGPTDPSDAFRSLRSASGSPDPAITGDADTDVDRPSARPHQDTAGLCDPYIAAEHGYVDMVINPSDTRAHVIRTLRLLRGKSATLPPRKHDNIPL